MIKCPTCQKSVSEYLETCPNCGASLTKGSKPVLTSSTISEATKTLSISSKKAIPIYKLNAKSIIIAVVAIGLLCCLIGYIVQPLRGNDKIAYDLITRHRTSFGSDIQVLSGTAYIFEDDNTKHAYLTIKYKNSLGNYKTGHYHLREEGITNLDNKSTLSIDFLLLNQYQIELSQKEDELNYERINKKLNK